METCNNFLPTQKSAECDQKMIMLKLGENNGAHDK